AGLRGPLPRDAARRVAARPGAGPRPPAGRRRLRAGAFGRARVAGARAVSPALRALDVRSDGFCCPRPLVVRRRPAPPARAESVFLPAFGAEMNQTRRMVKLAAEALGPRGIESVVFDPRGTGDSSAGFEEASVARWLADCRAIVARVQAEAPSRPLLLIGCR